jgi:hypothetical protein
VGASVGVSVGDVVLAPTLFVFIVVLAVGRFVVAGFGRTGGWVGLVVGETGHRLFASSHPRQ